MINSGTQTWNVSMQPEDAWGRIQLWTKLREFIAGVPFIWIDDKFSISSLDHYSYMWLAHTEVSKKNSSALEVIHFSLKLERVMSCINELCRQQIHFVMLTRCRMNGTPPSPATPSWWVKHCLISFQPNAQMLGFSTFVKCQHHLKRPNN